LPAEPVGATIKNLKIFVKRLLTKRENVLNMPYTHCGGGVFRQVNILVSHWAGKAQTTQ
jgi:hypothetical protein